MAQQNPWRDAPLSGDDLYGDRENLRRYRDFARDEHRRFAAQYEREQQGGLPGRDTLTEYDRFDMDLTGGAPPRQPNEYANRQQTPKADYRGRGPRGYQRSDQQLYEDVCEQLMEDDRIDASEVEVAVANGEVTLSGTVRSRQAKRRATDLAHFVRGIKDVHNSIRIVDEQVWPPKRQAGS
jgi:hypothetical protein